MKFASLMIYLLTCASVFASRKFKIPNEEEEKDKAYWHSLGLRDLEEASSRKTNLNIAKNVIIFIGDGMGITPITAARIFKGQKKGSSGEEESLVWEKWGNIALSKVYNLDSQVPDSAATATALFCGVKANRFTVGLTGKVKHQDCVSSLNEMHHLESILYWAQKGGKDTGFVTTTNVTDATPASLYAHSPERNWQSDVDFPQDKFRECGKDIARQLIENRPGKDVNVIMGGGRHKFGHLREKDSNESNPRIDQRDLIQEWLDNKTSECKEAKFITNKEELLNIDTTKSDYILGLFSDSDTQFNKLRESEPSLKEMTEVAIKRLSNNPNGFFLMVEGGRIDHGYHANMPHVALEETLDFEEAVKVAFNSTNPEETLIIVTADHSHVMTINGYPDRGNDILGKSQYEYTADGLPHTTLMFTNGPGFNYNGKDGKDLRPNLNDVDTTQYTYMSQAAVPTVFPQETHGGEDVPIYATGPMAHLFQKVHEQSYVAHVMAYAACIGPYSNDCRYPEPEADYWITVNIRPYFSWMYDWLPPWYSYY